MTGVVSPMEGVVYPPADVLQTYCDDNAFTGQSLAAGFNAALRDYGSRTALSGPEGVMSYADLDQRATQFAAALLELGLTPLDRVVFQLPNCSELIVALIACWKADLIPVCALPAHREQEIGYLANHAEARAHIVAGADEKFDAPEFALKMQKQVPTLSSVIVARGEAPTGAHAMDNLIDGVDISSAKDRLGEIRHDPFQVAVFQLSGGTTGVPKIIPRFSNEYLYNMLRSAAFTGFTKDDVVFCPTPIIHNAGMACLALPSLLAGAELVVAPTLDPPVFMQIMKEQKPTRFGVAGPMLSRLGAINFKNLVDLSHVHSVVSMNAARQVDEILGVKGVHIYGMAEGLICFTTVEDENQPRVETVGRPISDLDDVVIVRPGTEEPVAEGEIGELTVRGPYTIHGYYNAPERNREAFTSEGRYRSGDLMSYRNYGRQRYYVFEGRLKDVVDRGGEKINCEEVERALRAHPDIADAAVVGFSDADFGERACAALIANPGATAPSVKQLGAFLEKYGLAKFKWPERVEIFNEFPATKVGKLDKRALRAEVENRQEKGLAS